nr:MAG TPA: Terminase large subunit [Crassvirales sp.]
MENVKFNKCQTPLEDLHLENYPAEVQEQFWDFLNNVPFIRWMVSPDRPLVSELPRDNEGRAIIDITHPPILEDSDYFRPSALAFKRNKGRYTTLRPNANPNSDYGKWLYGERERGWNGYCNPKTGMWVTGDYYWMLNFCPMHLVEKNDKGVAMRTVAHPRFWDGQFLMSHYLNQGRLHGHHASALASRGRGKTSFGGGLLARRCIIGETGDNQKEVQCMVTAVDRVKLMDTNMILRVFKDNLDHCAKYTQFASHRLKSSDQEMEWKMGFKKAGSEVEYGSKNSVSGIISGVNQDKLNGSRGVLYLIEEAGIFKNLLSMYNMIRPSVEHGNEVFGEIFCYGTAGDDQSDFTAFAEMFYSPIGYNMEALDNVFDKEGQGRKQCCFFYGAYMNYDDSCIDENGNSDITKSLLAILYDRYKTKYGSTDVNTITKRISQYPIVPQEAMLRSHGNIFPVTELNERLNQLDNDPNAFDDVYVGELVQDNKTGEVKFNPTIDLPIRDFPTKDNKVKGALEIFEMPKKNGEGKIPAGRYICSADPYDADCSNTMSLGSIFVMDLWTDMIVAEYTGRPSFAEDFYEICRKLCLFYNCRCMYEQNVMGMFSYFSSHNATHLLAETPEYLVQRNMISSIGYGNKSVGIRATTPIINGAFKMIQTWLRKPIVSIETDTDGNNNEVTIPNLYRIKNRALLKELVLWNPQGNFDRIMSLVQLMLYREEKMVLYHGDLRHTEEVSSGIEKDDYWDKNYPGKKNYAIAVKSYYL